MTPEDDRGPPGVVATRLLVVVVVLAFVASVLTVVSWSLLDPGDAYPLPLTPVAAVVYASLGTLIVRRVANRIGWLLLAEGAAIALLTITSLYGVLGVARRFALPGAQLVGASSEWIFVPVVIGIAYILLVFPTGSLPSRRWRPVGILVLVATVLTTLAFVVTPHQVALPAPGGVSVTYGNPFGVRALRGLVLGTLTGGGIVSAVLFTSAVAALIVRYRSGSGERRQQIKWVAFAAAATLVSQIAITIALAFGHDTTMTTAVGFVAAAVPLFGIPTAITIATLKYRLYEIDLILNRAVVYTALAAALTVVYVGVVVGIGTFVGNRASPPLVIAAAVAIALLFQPLRTRAERLANRIVYGERATPYQVLSDLADRMANTFRLDDVLERTASVLAAGTGARRVDVWLRFDDELRPVSTWPPDATRRDAVRIDGEGELPTFDGVTRAAVVRHAGEVLGALTIQKPPNEPLTPTEDELVDDLASQAGLVLRNVRLTADLQASLDDLRASRRRLVEAQDEERRKIERNLHDGAQQQLVALTVQLGLLERLADDPERVRAMTAQLRAALGGALDDLRDLARGIFPPLLADKGLAAAIEAHARKSPVPTTVEADGVGRLPRDVEAAIYFCSLEALQNVAKYAGARSASVRLRGVDGGVEFEIADDGRGFDPESAERGSGLQGMVDRIDAVGGTLTIESRPGHGTVVRGAVPRAG